MGENAARAAGNGGMEPFYVGEYRRNLDGKKRVTVPAKWRFQGDEEDVYIAWTVPEGYIAVYPPRMIRQFREKIAEIPESDPRKQRMLRRLYGRAHQFGCDKQGRIMLDERLVEKTGIEKEVVVVGLGEHFNIWAAERWDSMRADDDDDFNAAMRDFGI